ncbi:MAG TPA: Bro-N domain-containing protein [Ktedonobacterales bacterium]|nr:Bro-N domain-containing protein [Ktedonobacterales bacterium]
MADGQQGDGQLSIFDAEATAQIRHVWHEGRWFFSVIDVVGMLTDSPNPRVYWGVLKRRLVDEGFGELFTNCKQLKMLASDGKQRLTDAADAETLLRIVQSIPSPKAEPLKQWLARVGTERLREMENPALAVDRLQREYRRLGYDDEWIGQRLLNIVTRDELTEEWQQRGAEEGRQFAVLTDTLHRGTFDVGVRDHQAIKHIGRAQNLRDSMTRVELALSTLAEATAAELHQTRDSQGFDALRSDTQEAGEVGGAARRDIEARTGHPVVSGENYKTLRQSRVTARQLPLPDAMDDATTDDESDT